MAISDTLTTRTALRRAVLEDLVERCTTAAVPIEGGPLDGIEVVSLATLREQVTAALEVDLPSPSARYAEVVTPARVLVSAICPECGLPAEISVTLSPQLTVDNDGAELAVKAKTKARVHVCGQLALPETAEQADFGLGDVVGADDCPFPGCALAAEHQGDHAIVEDAPDAAERIDTIYSQAAERVAEKRAGRVAAQGPGFTPAQAAQAAAELERDLDRRDV